MRNLEREIGAVLRNAAMKIAEGAAGQGRRSTQKTCTPSSARASSRTRSRSAPRCPGVATGLAWTPVGGDILFIEASKVPGSGKLILTGQLGDVMKESAQAALTLAKSYIGEVAREDRHPRPRAGGRDAQGRAVARAWRCSWR